MKKLLSVAVAVLLSFAALLPAFGAERWDADGDGSLTASDARFALRASVGLETPAPGSRRFLAADADGDGRLTASDARLLLRAGVGLPAGALTDPPEAGGVSAGLALAEARFGLTLLGKMLGGRAENAMASPFSVSSALAMTANGAEGETLRGILEALGAPDPDTLNKALYSAASALPERNGCFVRSANSLWVAPFAAPCVREPFLGANLRFYGAGVSLLPENGGGEALINNWVSEQTQGMIGQIVDRLPPDAAMVLLNALCMEAEWARPYREENVSPAPFASPEGEKTVDMMYGSETLYLENDAFTGFLKPYAGGDLAFAALLPKQDLAAGELPGAIGAEDFMSLLHSASYGHVEVAMPKFSFAYGASLRSALSEMGMARLFTPAAELSAMFAPPVQPMVSDVLHKTFIDVDTAGTRAAAATAVIVKDSAFFLDSHTVRLDRPFLFAIVLGEQRLPLFIGVVSDPSAGRQG